MSTVEQVLAKLEANFDAALERWLAWLRIPSISAQPAHAADCRAAAEFARSALAEIGFTATLRETGGHPALVAHHPGPGPRAPHLLYYGHYDVQPPDPLELWTSPPFAPVVVEGPHGKRVVGRGAVDDKGQAAMWLEAFRAWHAVTGSLPVRVSVLLEGEEEVGSINLAPFVAANRDELRADALVVSDTNMWDIDTPALTTSMRGLVYAEVRVKAASRDLHSGAYGGSALNPINALACVLGSLHDSAGRVQIPGFYDDVEEVSPAQRAAWEALGFDEGAFLRAIGLSQPAGERGRPALERLWARPTVDVNGIWGGYSGPGSKTVIAAEAGAKVSFRLVPNQDPDKVMAAFQQFVRERMPADAKLEFLDFGRGAPIRVAADAPIVRAAQAALAEEYGRPPVLIGAGGSIPVMATLHREIGLDPLLMGFSLEDDQPHSPNEKFEWRCFCHGARSHARLLAKVAAW